MLSLSTIKRYYDNMIRIDFNYVIYTAYSRHNSRAFYILRYVYETYPHTNRGNYI